MIKNKNTTRALEISKNSNVKSLFNVSNVKSSDSFVNFFYKNMKNYDR